MTQEQVAIRMGVSVARVSQIERGDVSTQDVLNRYVSALGGTLKLIADFGDEQLKIAKIASQIRVQNRLHRQQAPKITCHVRARSSQQRRTITSTQETFTRPLSCRRAVLSLAGDN